MARGGRAGAALMALAGAAVLLARLATRRRLELAGKGALVTGGSRGLGLLIALELGRRGARVAVCARDAAELERAREFLAGHGVRALALPCDVTDPAAVQRLVAEVIERLGSIDVLVNNAGVIQVGPAESMGPEDYRLALATMFWGPMHASEAVLPAMRARRGGTIVNVTSIGAAVAVPHLAPYAAAKFAQRGYSEALHAESLRHGVRVITVLPWLMRTGSVGHALVKGRRAAEASLFAVAGSAPLLTLSAPRCARRIVRAIERGESFLVLGALGKSLRLLHDLLPRATLALLGLVAALLPDAGGDRPTAAAVPGEEHRRGLGRSFLTALGDRAARRYNEQRAH